MLKIQKSIINLLIVTGGTFFGAGLSFLIQITLARNLAPEMYGTYSSIYYMVTTMAPLCGFGAPQLLLRIYGQYGWDGSQLVKPIFKFVTISTFITFLLLVIWSIFFQKESSLQLIALLMSFLIFGQLTTEIISSIFQLEEKFFAFSFWMFFQTLARFILLFSIIFIFQIQLTILDVAKVFFIVSLAVFFIGLVKLVKFYNGKINLKGHHEPNSSIKLSSSYLDMAKQALPFGLAGTFYLVYYQMGVYFVREFVGSIEAGYYSAAYLIFSIPMILPGIIYHKFLMPKQHRWAYHDKEKLMEVYKKGNKIMLSLGIILMTIMYFGSSTYIPLLFGVDYLKSIPLLNILLLNLPIVFLASNVSSTLVTGDNMVRKVRYMGFVALISIFLSVIFLPKYGAKAQAVVNIICNLILLFLYLMDIRKFVSSNEKQ